MDAGLTARCWPSSCLLPLIGFRTVQNIRNEIVLETRWQMLVRFRRHGGDPERLFYSLVITPWARAPAQPQARPPAATVARLRPILGALVRALLHRLRAGLSGALSIGPRRFPGLGEVDRQISASQILIYVMLGLGPLNIVVRARGPASISATSPSTRSAAYSYAPARERRFGFSFLHAAAASPDAWPPSGGILARASGAAACAADYLAIVTLAFGEIIRLVLINLGSTSPTGMPASAAFRAPAFFGIPFTADDDGFSRRTFGLEFSPLYRTIFLYYLILGLGAAGPPSSPSGCAAWPESGAPGRRCARTEIRVPLASASTPPTPS